MAIFKKHQSYKRKEKTSLFEHSEAIIAIKSHLVLENLRSNSRSHIQISTTGSTHDDLIVLQPH